MPPVIEVLALRMADTKGLDYQSALRNLKYYLKANDDSYLIREIQRIEDHRAFNQLWSCGLSAYLQEVASDRWKELTDAQKA